MHRLTFSCSARPNFLPPPPPTELAITAQGAPLGEAEILICSRQSAENELQPLQEAGSVAGSHYAQPFPPAFPFAGFASGRDGRLP